MYDQGYLQYGVPKTTEKLQSLVYNKVCFLSHSKIYTRLSKPPHIVHKYLNFTITKVYIIGHNKCWRQKHKCSYHRALHPTEACKFYHDSGIYIYHVNNHLLIHSINLKNFPKYANIIIGSTRGNDHS